MEDLQESLENLATQHPVVFEPASSEDLNALAELKVPAFLKDFYGLHEPHCTSGPEDVPDLRWLSIKGILGEVSSMDPSHTLGMHGYIPFASTCYGNVYVFNCNKVDEQHGPEVCFASHERFMGGEDKDYVDRNIEVVASSLREFMQNILKGVLQK